MTQRQALSGLRRRLRTYLQPVDRDEAASMRSRRAAASLDDKDDGSHSRTRLIESRLRCTRGVQSVLAWKARERASDAKKGQVRVTVFHSMNCVGCQLVYDMCGLPE